MITYMSKWLGNYLWVKLGWGMLLFFVRLCLVLVYLIFITKARRNIK